MYSKHPCLPMYIPFYSNKCRTSFVSFPDCHMTLTIDKIVPLNYYSDSYCNNFCSNNLILLILRNCCWPSAAATYYERESCLWSSWWPVKSSNTLYNFWTYSIYEKGTIDLSSLVSPSVRSFFCPSISRQPTIRFFWFLVCRLGMQIVTVPNFKKCDGWAWKSGRNF